MMPQDPTAAGDFERRTDVDAETDVPVTTAGRRSAPSAWNLPNALTVLRIALVPVFGWLLLVQNGSNAGYRLSAFAVFAVAMLTDSIDGDIARRRGLITDFGKVSDPIADKALIGTAFVALSVIGDIWWWVTALVLVREVGITVMRFVVIRHGVMPAGRGGKLKTALQAAAVAMLVFPLGLLPFSGLLRVAADVVLAAAVAVTVGTGVDYLVKARRLRRTSARALAKRAARRPGERGTGAPREH